MEHYDLCVIGGGPAGYAAAMRAIDFGKRVVLIEKKQLGGTGIFHGALSSKTLWELSEKMYDANHVFTDRETPQFEITWNEVQKTLHEALLERKFQYTLHLNLLQKVPLNSLFTYERGKGKFLDKNHIEITRENESSIIKADFTIVATGSKPRQLPQYEIDEKTILSSDGIDNISDFPESIVIVGAGVIGCEYATIFSNFGKTKVYLIDRQDRILPFEDPDISEIVARNLEKNGVIIHRNATLESLKHSNGGVTYKLKYPDDSTEVIHVNKALISIGRTPNTQGLGLEDIGVETEGSGGRIIDNDTQTSVPNIFAAGDVTGHIALVNMGEIEARHAVEKMFDNKSERLSYDNVSTIMFTHPTVASVGMHEVECRAKNIPHRVVKIDYSLIARAIAMRKTEGFFKIVVTNDEHMKILGMRACGEHSSSAIQAVALLIKMNAGIEELAELVHPHPSIIEGIQECVRMLLNKSIFKASVFSDKMKCYAWENNKVEVLERL
jgi:dihydrolipoamide dehydrogenase